jgi:chromosome segregation ATPase
MYSRFVATRVPERLTKGKRFLKVEIDSSLSDHNMYIREAGTIDFIDTVDNTKQDLINTKQDLTNTKQDLVNTKQDLVNTKQDLVNTKQELMTTKQDLNSAKQSVANLGVQVANMGKSIKVIQETPVKSSCAIS